MQLLTSGLGTNDDPQPPATPPAVPPTTRLAGGLNFDLLNRRRLVLHLCWPNRWWTHWRWKIGFRISPRHITLQRIAQACRRDRHCACVAPTTLAGRPPQSFRWIKANWARHHCDTPTIDGLGRCDGTHTHCLTPILSTVTRENGKPSFGQQWLTIAVHNCGSGSPATTKWSLSLFKRLLEFARVWKLLGPRVCCFAHSNDTPPLSDLYDAASACMDVHSNNLLEVPRRRGILHV